MGLEDFLRVMRIESDPEMQKYIPKARRDMDFLLNGFHPQEGESYDPDYGPLMPQMTRLLQAFERENLRSLRQEFARMLHGKEAAEARVLLPEVSGDDGRPWLEVLEELWEKMEAEERRAAAERRMKARLARTTGDSMADEILAMLREQDLSRTDIYRRYSRNISAQQINDALFVLERLGWARWKMVSTGGRQREVWFLPPDEAW